MARETEARCKRCRAYGDKLFLKGMKCSTDRCPLAKRPYAPGQHGKRRKKESNYGLQLSEKQKVRPITLNRHTDHDLETHFVTEEGSKSATPVPVSGQIKVTSAKGPKRRGSFVPPSYEDYTLPPLELLDEPEYTVAGAYPYDAHGNGSDEDENVKGVDSPFYIGNVLGPEIL